MCHVTGPIVLDKLENGEIDVIGDISYTDERAQKMLFSDEPMGEEKLYSLCGSVRYR